MHDVSDEPRDEGGKWTADGSAVKIPSGLEHLTDKELREHGRNYGRAATDAVRNQLMTEGINRLPRGTYLLTREGMASPSLMVKLSKKLGYNVLPSELERFVRGMSATNPNSVKASLTLGLDEVRLLGNRAPTIAGGLFGGSVHPARGDTESRGVLPVDLSTEQWQGITQAVKERAIFSAHVTDARFLQQVKDTTARLVSPEFGAGGELNAPGEYVNPATARATLRDAMQSIGYEPAENGPAVPMAQLSDARLDLIIKTNRDLAWGFAEAKAGNTPEQLDAFPCWELVRAAPVAVPRDWPERWAAAGGEFYGGRMIARKDDDVWQSLGDGEGLDAHDGRDAIGNPYPPFAFNSEMWVTDVSRAEAEELGVIEPGEVVEATEAGLNDGLEAGATGLDGFILGALLASVGGMFHAEHNAVSLANRDVEDEPRDEKSGRWTDSGGGIALERSAPDAEGKSKWQVQGGGKIPEHAAKLGIPPAWKDVSIAPSAEHELQAIGTDSKGRVQRIYSDAFTARMAAEKFSRNKELIEKQSTIFAQTRRDLKSEDKRTRENAACMSLIQQTGIRPGSETDTGAEKQAYGATTLEGRHVIADGKGNVRLQFIGKKGVSLDIAVDNETGKMLLERKAAVGDNGKLFATDSASLRDYSHTLDGGNFKPKDFRTLKGTQTAMESIKENPSRCSTLKEYKNRVRDIAKLVSSKLGNTPAIALQSYINPFVFSSIKPLTMAA